MENLEYMIFPLEARYKVYHEERTYIPTVTLLFDTSGSVWGDPVERTAVISAVLSVFNDLFAKFQYIRLAMTYFSDIPEDEYVPCEGLRWRNKMCIYYDEMATKHKVNNMFLMSKDNARVVVSTGGTNPNPAWRAVIGVIKQKSWEMPPTYTIIATDGYIPTLEIPNEYYDLSSIFILITPNGTTDFDVIYPSKYTGKITVMKIAI
ncbi:MAG: VWA domain-containing protein [Thermoproteus sp.]|nr:VWA domain-containing protein [Thermoproteus sp.]